MAPHDCCSHSGQWCRVKTTRCVFEQNQPWEGQKDPECHSHLLSHHSVHSADEDVGTQRETTGDIHLVTFSKAIEEWHLRTGITGFLVTLEVLC